MKQEPGLCSLDHVLELVSNDELKSKNSTVYLRKNAGGPKSIGIWMVDGVGL